MSDTPVIETPPDPGNRQRILRILLLGAFLLVQSVAFIWLVDRLAASDWERAAWIGQFEIAMIAGALAIHAAAARRKQLVLPLRKLEALLPEIHAGRLPIDELSQVTGKLAPLAASIREVLTDLRSHRAGLATEVRQRVANKTESLERQIGSLKQQATRDALTGLLNRRALDEHLAKAVSKAGKTGDTLSVLMIDVDNFKPLNDTLGHAAGDELLRSIGQILRSTLRPTDAAFRCGGDEFVVVLGGADSNAAKSMADRLTSLVDGLVKTLKVAALPRLSIGAASLQEMAEPTPDALMHEADKALYAVKGTRKRIPRQVNALSGPLRAAPPLVQSPASPR